MRRDETWCDGPKSSASSPIGSSIVSPTTSSPKMATICGVTENSNGESSSQRSSRRNGRRSGQRNGRRNDQCNGQRNGLQQDGDEGQEEAEDELGIRLEVEAFDERVEDEVDCAADRDEVRVAEGQHLGDAVVPVASAVTGM